MSDVQNWVPQSVDVSVPSAARVYDYLLGGAHNFAVDRLMGDKAEQMMPNSRNAARLNRAFLRRAVRFMTEQGVRQFLDIGSGIPTVANVHEVAQEEHPSCRVMYVDRDPVAVAHGELIIAGNDRVGVLQADMRDPDSILNSGEVNRLLDFGQPIGLLMLFMVHWVPDEADPQSLLKRYREALPSGSYLAISHMAGDHVNDDARSVTDRMAKAGGGDVTYRDRAEVESFFGDFELVEPGLVKFAEWRPSGPGDVSDDPAVNRIAFAGVGRKP
ncbi:SAM-dependent methyltransferase [Lentzea californiensis]|uniref:SAM-dependent methyltransferase n=1 Tax=Lentzea californiensis TaxID=438851 RepID=UPI00216473C7|nr:SAM-dependent methyltransferase [Lentzea californiensis]MCR3748083.1 S-adenosyl methyltransferase [Lentzea californiensis]